MCETVADMVVVNEWENSSRAQEYKTKIQTNHSGPQFYQENESGNNGRHNENYVFPDQLVGAR